MNWHQRYRLRLWIEDSIWILPVLSMVVALVLVRSLHQVEVEWGWSSTVDPNTARAVFGTLAASMFTFIVFVSSALLVAVQLASATLSPRIIGLVFRDPKTKLSLTAFVFTFTFTLATLVLIDDHVPQLTAYVAAYGSLLSLGIFLYMLDHVGKTLRPSGALWNVAANGRKVIASVYPHRLGEAQQSSVSAIIAPLGEPTRTIASDRDGAVLAFDIPGLVALARRNECVIELAPQVGDFVAKGDPLLHVYGDAIALSDSRLSNCVAVGQERTLEQDPALAFRIIVDIANKGLSPAINDPTTAVLALDQIHHLLRSVGVRRLDDERVRDKAGKLRLLYRTPDWEDFVRLAVTEIRQFGGTSIQIARRMRAMLESLIQTLPVERGTLLTKELNLLQRSAERSFPEPEDRAMAQTSDYQGVGGRHDANRNRRGNDKTTP